jgi:predicted GTPase
MISPLTAVLQKYLQKHGHTWEMYLIQNWTRIVGNLHTRMCLEKIQGDTLVIGVYDSHWMQELFLLQNMLISMINGHFDKPYVKNIRLKLAKQAERKKKKQEPKKAVKQPATLLTEQHQQALDQVKDEQLQKILQEFLQHCK